MCLAKIHNTVTFVRAQTLTAGGGGEGERGPRIYPGLNAIEIQIPHVKHHEVSLLVKSHQKHTQFCQI